MIVANAGHEGAVVVEKVKLNNNQNYGFNAETETFGDLVAEGVIDPTKVTRAALQNAASIASLLLTTEASVSEYPDREEKASAGPPGRHGRRDVLRSGPHSSVAGEQGFSLYPCFAAPLRLSSAGSRFSRIQQADFTSRWQSSGNSSSI